MSNEAAIILNEIQFKTGKTLEEIAGEIGYSRPYLNNVKLKGGGEKVIGILKEKYHKILQNVPRGTNGEMTTYSNIPSFQTKGGVSDEAARIIKEKDERIKELKEQIEFLKEMIQQKNEKR